MIILKSRYRGVVLGGLLAVTIAGCIRPTVTQSPSVTPETALAARYDRPNILLIVAEDMSPRAGAYGDEVAQTPTLDGLAADGMRFDNVFSVAGVCAPNRSSLITGVYTISMGTHQMRTSQGVPDSDIDSYEAVPPADVKAFPELLRAAGYATANFAKKDYQFGEPFTIWDVDTGNFFSPLDPAVWRQLPDDKPFFAMVNLMVTHESRLATVDGEYPEQWANMLKNLATSRAEMVNAVTDPRDVIVPPYYPDTPAVRESIAQYYDNVHYMDRQVSDILAALEEDGLAKETVVIWTTDHGDPFPRAKRSVYDSGLRVPMIIRFPDGFGAGTVQDELVSFVDIAPTVLELAGVEIPPFIQGQSFLDAEIRDFVFAARDRMDETPDRVRAAGDGRYKYIRNLMPELPYFRPLAFRDMFPIMREWWAGYSNGTLDRTQRFYFEAPRPREELYDTRHDPWETSNLASNPEFADELKRLSTALDGWIEAVGDMGGRPELEMVEEMWSGHQQPPTPAPRMEFEVGADGNALLILSNEKSGASIGYRVGDGPWQLYTGPVHVESGQSIEAKAIRYGFRESPVATVLSAP